MAMAMGMRVAVAILVIEVEVVAPFALPRRRLIGFSLFCSTNDNECAHLLLRLLTAGRARNELQDFAHWHPLLEGGAALGAAILVQGHRVSSDCERFQAGGLSS